MTAGRDQRPRVLLGVAEISGWYARLADGLAIEGRPATLVTLDAHPFGYETTHGAVHWTVPWIRRCRARAASGGATGSAWRAPEMALRALLLVWALRRFDVFVFGFRTTFLKLADLPVLRLFGKRIVMVFHGSDERPPYMDGFIDDDQDGPTLLAATRRQKQRVRWCERWADACVSNPLSAQFHAKPVVLLQAIGQPVAVPAAVTPLSGADGSDPALPVRVVHAPSNPVAKGTAEVRRVVAALQGEGLSIDYVELTGRSNEEVLAELDRADVAVDQRWSDISHSIFAAEAAAHGRPAVVGTYGQRDLEAITEGIELPPAAYVHPDHLADGLRQLVTRPALRRELGASARRVVADGWSCEAVARKMLLVIDDSFPASWLWDPSGLTYERGAGLGEERLRRQVRDVIAAGGVDGLCLDDRPAIRSRLLDLAADG